MLGRYLLDTKCPKCKTEIEQEMPLFVSFEDKVYLTCPKCGAKIKYWIELKQKSKIIK